MLEDGGGASDFHSHLVPGVDDGAQTLEDALEAVQSMVDAGIGRILTTPHLRGSLTHDVPELERRLAEVDVAWKAISGAVQTRFPGVEFRRGHEVMLDVPDPDLSDARLRLAGTAFVLIEWPRLQIPPRTEPVLRRLCSQGCRPIIAHPERYQGIEHEIELAGEWRSAGAYLQVNNGSLVGRYGPQARNVAIDLLARGWVDYLSSDFHARPHLSVYLEEAKAFFDERSGWEQFHLLTVSNPTRLLRGEVPLSVPGLQFRRGFWHRMRGVFGG